MTDRPNIIVIMADDMGYGDLACVNGGINRTPVLDTLYGESLRLSQAYAGSCVCAPSRASFLTGRYPQRTGCTCLNDIHGLNRLDTRETTIADIFAKAGYHTGLIGKWHCGRPDVYRPQRRGFQHVEAFHPMGFDYWNWKLDVNGTERASNGQYLTDHLGERSVQYVRDHKHEPFFLHLAHYAPHRPLQAPPELLAKYEEQDGLSSGQATVYAMLESMDTAIGRLLDTLREEGIEDNTIVVFTSDNGPDTHAVEGLSPARFNCGLRGAKYSVHEGGIRVPTMIRWPDGIAGPGNTDVMFHFVDLLPTLASLSGVTLPETIQLDGEDRSPAWRGNEANVNPTRFWQWNRHMPYPNCNAAVRDGDWKLVFPKLKGYNRLSEANIEMIEGKRPFQTTRPEPLDIGPPQQPLLFNLADDPLEANDLADVRPDTVRRLVAALDRWQRDVMIDLDQLLDRRFPN